jgi:hypothetical protein
MRTAIVRLPKPVEGCAEFYWASLDGEHFLPVSRLPLPGEEAEVQRLFDGDGNFKPMTWAPRAVRWTAEENDGTVEFRDVTTETQPA